MTVALTEKQIAFKAFLEDVATMTEEDLVAAVAGLPPDIRDALASGPVDRRWSCGVCIAFGEAWYVGEPDATDPMWRAWGYHEAPKATFTYADQNHYGATANDIYERCIATYRAAGWTGDAAEANA